MRNIEEIDYEKFKNFEERINGNVRVGGYKMDKISPLSEGRFFKVELEQNDIERLFLLREPTFKHLTLNKNYHLSELLQDAANVERVKSWLDSSLDLRRRPEWAPELITTDIKVGSLVAIDGNHRLMAHYLLNKSVDGVTAYLFSHSNLKNWGMYPTLAN